MTQPPPRLTTTEIQKALTELPGWSLINDTLEKAFTFSDFSEAFGFMARVALLCEAQNHHPDWHNIWNRVHIRLSTHESHGLTERDLRLARAIEQVLQSCQ